ncbi:CPBP family intramembrane glutamic endopeptidase [Leucobacter chromiiresistens]|uniref:Membrane protease YdiL, CAAX protease family n=1 Tax=Leucobacter chromiiresistens TaxID=1079994 RepID=A0A1H0YDJ5_9MICO|nr:type II CAAX endopeptidase family protein [Leucobacter chromiiresistens]SDQ13011.1 Membrane protease YdiL, CAAX protease family [Leucobacter chromiiresistens]
MTSTGSEPPERPDLPSQQPHGPVPPQAQPGLGQSLAEPSAPGQPGGPAPEWAWARPQVALQTVETEPLEYHRLLRGVANYRWWRPLVLLLLSGVYFGVFTIIVSIAFIPILMTDPSYLDGIVTGEGEVLDTQVPVSVLLSLVSIIIMIPAVILAMLTLGMRPTGRVWSVAGRIRWGLLGRVSIAALLAVVVMNVAGIAFEIAMDPASLSETAETSSSGADFDWTAAWTSLIIIVLLVPLQATAEEVVFRGLFMQVLGSWLKSPWFGIVIPSVGFALAHIYDIWGLLSVGALGLVAGWLTWRTGGLEAAIAIHIVNNLIAFGFMTFAVGGETAQVEATGGPGSFLGSVVGYAVFIWLVLRIFRKHGYGRSRIDLIRVPAPLPQAAAEAPAFGAEPGQESQPRG